MPVYEPRATNLDGLSDMVRAYLECAEWSGVDDEQREAFEESNAPRWNEESIAKAIFECGDFAGTGGAKARNRYRKVWEDAGWSDSDAGHDFWLTRNRHGVGFWDRGRGKAGETLTERAHVYGEQSVWFDAETGTLTLEG